MVVKLDVAIVQECAFKLYEISRIGLAATLGQDGELSGSASEALWMPFATVEPICEQVFEAMGVGKAVEICVLMLEGFLPHFQRNHPTNRSYARAIRMIRGRLADPASPLPTSYPRILRSPGTAKFWFAIGDLLEVAQLLGVEPYPVGVWVKDGAKRRYEIVQTSDFEPPWRWSRCASTIEHVLSAWSELVRENLHLDQERTSTCENKNADALYREPKYSLNPDLPGIWTTYLHIAELADLIMIYGTRRS